MLQYSIPNKHQDSDFFLFVKFLWYLFTVCDIKCSVYSGWWSPKVKDNHALLVSGAEGTEEICFDQSVFAIEDDVLPRVEYPFSRLEVVTRPAFPTTASVQIVCEE